MKKLLSLILALMMMVGLMVPSFAADGLVTLTVDKQNIKVGETFNFVVNVSGVSPNKAATIVVTYDKNVFSLNKEGCKWTYNAYGLAKFDVETGQGAFAFVDPTELNGDVFILSFVAEDAADDSVISVTFASGTNNNTAVSLPTATAEISVEGNQFDEVSLTGVNEGDNFWKEEGYTVQLTGNKVEGATTTYKLEKKNDADEYVDVTLTNPNDAPTVKELGEYKVTATLSKKGYNSVTKDIEFKIVNQKFEDGDVSFTFAGNNITSVAKASCVYGASDMTFTAKAEKHEKVAISITGFGITVSGEGSASYTFTKAGTYEVEVTVSKDGFDTREFTKTIEITPKELTVSGVSIKDKVYDGSTAAETQGTAVLVGVVDADKDNISVVEPDADPVFASKNVGEDIAVTWGSFTLAGDDDVIANYTLTQPTFTANITKKLLTVTAVSITINREDEETFSDFASTKVGLVNNETVEVSLKKEFKETDKDTGNTIYNIVLAEEIDADNYEISFVPGTLTVVDRICNGITVERAEGVSEDKTYIVDQKFDRNDIVVKATYQLANGYTSDPEIITNYTIQDGEKIEDEIFTGDFSDEGENVILTISYLNKTAEYTAKVRDKKITGIEIDAEASTAKTKFVEGNAFDSKGLVVKGIYDNGMEYTLDETDYEVVTPTERFDKNNLAAGNYTINVVAIEADSIGNDDYETTVSYDITVDVKDLASIAVTALPADTDYVAGQTFDITDMVVTAVYNNGTSNPIGKIVYGDEGVVVTNGYTVTPEILSVGVDKVTISYTYKGTKEITKTATVDVTVAAKAVDSIAVKNGTAPKTTEYIENQKFDPYGLIFVVTYNDEEVVEIGEDGKFDGFKFTPEPLKAGTEKVTATYGGKSTDITIAKVEGRKIKSIDITSFNAEVVDGDKIASAINTVKVLYNNGVDEDNDFKGYTVVDGEKTFKLTDPTKAQTIEVTVTCNGVDADGKDAVLKDVVEVTVLPCEATNETTQKNYQYFAEAVAEAAEGDTIALKNNVVLAANLVIDKDLTIATGENKLSAADGVSIEIEKKAKLVFNTLGATEPLEIPVDGKIVTVEPGVSEYAVKTSNIGSVARQITNAYKYIETFYHDIVIENTKNGTINGRLKVKVGEDAKFTITPADGYVVEDVLVDATSVGAVTEYEFVDVRDSHTISAVFAEKAE